MILTSSQILGEMRAGRLTIEPFLKHQLGPNSYDVRLAPVLYLIDEPVLDLKKPYHYVEKTIPDGGMFLEPGQLYLGVTMERTTTPFHVPVYDGRSTMGRYFLSSHQTAGFGDLGFDGHWTLELSVLRTLRIYPCMRVGQIRFHAVQGNNERLYGGRYNSPERRPRPAAAGNL